MPKIAVFPKAYMNALCIDGSMKLADWVLMASQLNVSGLEWYAGFLEMKDEANWARFRALVHEKGMEIPMLCCSPDFTHPDPGFRKRQIERQLYWIRMAHSLGAAYCRVLSGQRRPGIGLAEGIEFAVECIMECLPFAREMGVKLILENHYKDDFWEYPEFAQKMNVFCQLVDRIQHPDFGVNYDPSNTYLAGEDPLELLRRVASRVFTMHASDRYLVSGTLQDLRAEEVGSVGYAKRLRHGEIGKGLNDYNAIFKCLKEAGFDGWISIEDGVEGMDQLERSVIFLIDKIGRYWPDFQPRTPS